MTVHKVGVTVVRHQDTQGRTLRLHLWYFGGMPIEPELITALRGWDHLRPVGEDGRSVVGQLSASRIFIDFARADDLRPPYRRKRRMNTHLTPSEVRRHVAIGERLWQLELWLLRWYRVGESDGNGGRNALIVTQQYPSYSVRQFGIHPVPRRPDKGQITS